MTIDSTVSNVINLPLNLYGGGNTSIYSLLQQSGYFDLHYEVTESLIHDALRKNPQAMSHWVDFSAAKRANSGWFLRGCEAGGYQVGRYPDQEPVGYSDDLAACAAFIKREIEEIRTDGNRT